MTCELYIKSLILALQNRGGYWCRLVKDNSSDRRYCILSWLFATTSAFSWLYAYGMPPTCRLFPSEPHRNLIGTSSELHRRDTEGTQGEYIRDV